MGSLFINAGLAAGVALAAVPVILHLFMKQTPKHVIFPALRLIKERQKRSKKKLRVKNWLLLLARMALLALMALALARPRIHAKTSLGTGDEPTALAFVFDTSLSMEYKERDKSRLDSAKELAIQVLKAMNEQSRVFVVDSADPGPPVATSPAAARKRIDGLQIRPMNRTLNGAIGAAYAAVAGVDLARREVYVLTDLAASQWQTGQEVEGLAQAMKSLKSGKIVTFVLRAGAKDLSDVAIVSAEPDAPVITEDRPVNLKVTLRNVGPKTTRIVEVRVDGAPDPRGKVQVEIPASGEIEVPPIATTKLDVGVHQFEVKLSGVPDPMKFDDVRYVTVYVQPAIKILLVSDRAEDRDDPDTIFVAQALNPAAFKVTKMRTSRMEQLEMRTLREYAAVFVLNAKELHQAPWEKLFRYVTEGGGLVVAPGANAKPEDYNAGLASELLPAALDKVRDHRGVEPPFRFGKPDLGSPIFAHNQKELLADLALAPIFKTWSVKSDTGGKAARVLLRYTDDSPALFEKVLSGPRAGKVLMWTTPLSRRVEPNDRNAWNEFPNFWSFLQIIDQSAFYLAGTAGQRLVFESGEDALLAVDPTRQYSTYRVLANGKPSDRTAESVAAGSVMVASPGELGQWDVTAKTREGAETKLGFSVNPPRGEIATASLDAKDLDTLFGKGNYQLATDAASLKHVQGEAIFGHEIFPWVMALILLVVTLENLLANTFYRERTGAPAIAAARAA